ncbi:hypothetical protein CCHL11_10161 [Colletotrichum chlorophyti]|uniref:Nucleolar protein n=1 Tax=Colletotrichum chlorophyti TaxID=708187 RepID=A0A1Q8RAL1_9PEZI|nr:hypothetical protein CCHL11_10161 [Colletotrichum chlorophyti]
MFELPDAKRVRRDELDSESENEAAAHDERQDAELLAKLHARMAGMLDLGNMEETTTATSKEGKAGTKPDDQSEGMDVDKEPEEFEFRLFTTTDPATKIALVDEDELALMGDGDIVRPRPLAHYIAGEPTPEAKAEFEFAAVSGEDVLRRAGQRWWGMEMPWRVVRAEAPPPRKGKGAAEGEGEGAGAAAKRRRPGKKKRVALRMKERDRKKKAEEQEKAKMGKEEALKEKKKRLNRLKKLRKRAKAKQGKEGEGGAAGEDSGSGSEGGDE